MRSVRLEEFVAFDSVPAVPMNDGLRAFKKGHRALPFPRLSPTGIHRADVLGFVPAGSLSRSPTS